MKQKIFYLALALCCTSLAYTQQPFPGIRSLTYAGAGVFLPSSTMNRYSKIGNGVNFSFGHFQSIGKPKKGWQLGVEARLNYSKFEKDLWAPSSYLNMYYDYGSGTPTLMPMILETEKKKPDAFHFLIGPSALIYYKKFLFQPSLMVGYASVSQEKFHYYSIVPVPPIPSRDTTFNFYSGGHETNNGFVFVPGIKLGYRIHKNIAAFISFEYSIGSKQEFSDSLLVGLIHGSNVYDYNDLTDGYYINFTRESYLRALLINFQVAFILPRK